MSVSFCSVLPPENWSDYLPNKGNSLLTYLLTCLKGLTLFYHIPHKNEMHMSLEIY